MKRHYVGRTTSDKCTIPPAPYWASAESLKRVEIHDFSAMWTLGARTEQDRAGQSTPKTLKIIGKSNDSASRVHGALDGRPLASRGRRWNLQGDMQKPLGKRWFSVCANIISGAPVPSWAEQDRAGHSTPKTLKIVGKINNSTNTASKHSKEEIRSENFRITFQRL